MRLALLLVASLTAALAFDQHQYDLATTRDGSVLYFSNFSDDGIDTKIYRWTQASGVTLFGDRPDLQHTPPHYGEHLYGTQTTNTGTVLYHAEPLCQTGFGPGFNDCTIGETQIVIPGLPPFSVPGFLLVSPNGRYGVFATFDTRVVWVDWFTGEQIVVDFPYQTIANVSPPFSVNQHAIANNGRFLIRDGAGLRIWSKNEEILLPTTDTVLNAMISADGSTVAVTSRAPNSPDPFAIPTYVYDLPSGRKTKLAYVVSLSEDGQTIAYLDSNIYVPKGHAQARVSRSDGTGARQITDVSGTVVSAILSGDARYLYVVIWDNPFYSEASHIQRYEVSTGAIEEIPAVP